MKGSEQSFQNFSFSFNSSMKHVVTSGNETYFWGLRSCQENKKFGPAISEELFWFYILYYSKNLFFTWFHVTHIYSCMILNRNRKMSYHLQSYFPGIYFTAEFTFLFPPGIRTLPETNVLCLEWRYLSAEVDFAQTWEKSGLVVLSKLFPGLAETCISFTGCFFIILNFKRMFYHSLPSLVENSSVKL